MSARRRQSKTYSDTSLLSSSYRVLVATTIHPIFTQVLREHGWQVNTLDSVNEQALIQAGKSGQYDILVVGTRTPVTERVVHAWQGKIFARPGSGIDHLPFAALRRWKVRIVRTPEGNAPAVVEYTLLLMLALLRWFPRHLAAGVVRPWRRPLDAMGELLAGKRVGIAGVGHIGWRLASVLTQMGASVLCWDPFVSVRQVRQLAGAQKVSTLQELIACSDILTLHLPLTATTREIINHETLRYARHPLYIINTARGSLIRIPDLLVALDEGIVQAAALDVLPCEPEFRDAPWWDSLRRHPRVILTPHMAGHTVESREWVARLLAQKLLRVMRWRRGEGF